jgi:hypothetical protein
MKPCVRFFNRATRYRYLKNHTDIGNNMFSRVIVPIIGYTLLAALLAFQFGGIFLFIIILICLLMSIK